MFFRVPSQSLGCVLKKLMLSVLWHCWLEGRKTIQPLKIWAVGWRCGYLSGTRCRFAYGPADATATQSLASVKSRLVLPFCYWLIWVVPDKGLLNGCYCTEETKPNTTKANHTRTKWH